jgi:uncharacterized protein (TIGR03000 family)
MIRKMLLTGGLVLLTGALLLTMPGFGQARGGGHAGGGHFGGGHFGGAHFGGGHYGGFYHGDAHYGGYRYGGYHYGRSYGRYGYPYYGGYGYYPYSYGSYGYSYPSYDWSIPTYDSGYAGTYGDGATSALPSAGAYQAFYPPATDSTPSDTSAHVTITVPAGAQVWFDDHPTTTTGSVRQFDSPALKPGSKYSYEIRARWNDNGHEVTQTQKVGVTAGAHVDVKFPVAPKTAAQASAKQ